MNIREMSIEVAMGTQNIAANTRRKLLNDEIDWLLNKNQDRFIQARVRPRKDGSGGFEIDQIEVDAIRTLIKTEEPSLEYTATGSYSVQLPADYSYLISDDSKTVMLCGADRPALTTITDNILVVPLKTAKSTAKFFATIVLTVGSTTTSLADIVTLYQATYTGLNSKEERYLVRDAMLWYIRTVLSIPVYWEYYRNLYKPGCFIFTGYTAGSIVVDAGSAVNGTTSTQTYTRYDSSEGTWASNRLNPSDKISTMLTTPFVKPNKRSPISELSGRQLTVYADTSFIVTGVRVSYVKKPRRLSLALSQDCELPEDFHQAVCDLTVEYYKAMTSDPSWEVKLKDNMSRSVT